MIAKDFDTAYVDWTLERDYPAAPPPEDEGVDSLQFAAGPSGTMSDAGSGMATIKPTPRNPVMGGVADFVRGVRDLANQYEIKEWVPLLGKMGVGDLLLGKSPEELEDWAYGNAPFAMPPRGTGGLVPVVKTGRKEQLFDATMLGLDAAGLGKGAGVAARGAAKGAVATAKFVAPKAGEMLSDYVRRTGMQLDLMAYHGSPHKFDKFDSSKIGTGEGQQAYGHGLYFAENKGVAREYRNNLSTIDTFVNGKPVTPNDPNFEAAINVAKYGYDEALRLAQEYSTSSFLNDAGRAGYAKLIKEIEALKGKKVTEKKGGAVFTVDIPDAMVGKMLDFDKPLREQTPEIQAKLKTVVDGQMGAGTWNEWIKSDPDLRNLQNDLFEGKAPEEISALLREAGIPGIRYLDRGSRPSNVIDRKLLDLFEKHGDVAKAVDEMMASVYNTPARKEKMRQEFTRQLEAGVTRNIVVFPGGEDQIKIIKTEGAK